MPDIRRSVFVLPLMVLLVLPVLSQTANLKVRVIVESANIRLKADPASEVITSVPMGAVLAAAMKKGEWFLVELPRNEQGITVSGYLHESGVEVISGDVGQTQAAPPPPPPPQQAQTQQPPPPPSAYSTPYPRTDPSGFKIMGGLSLANVSFEDDPQVTFSPTDRTGFIAGLGFELGFGSSAVLEIDALYFQKGFKYQEKRATEIQIGNDVYSFEDRLTMKTDVISVPVLLKFRLGKGGIVPYFGGGFEGAFVLSNKVDYTGVTYKNGSVDSEEKSTEDVKDYTESMDYGPVFNVGLEFNMGRTRLFIDGRYHLGIANMLKLDDIQEDVDEDAWIKSKAIVVMAGLKF